MNADKCKVKPLEAKEIRPCDFCGGKLYPIFRVIQVHYAAFNPSETRQFLGLSMFFGSPALAEVFGAGPIADILLDQGTIGKIFCCQECFLKGPLDLATAMERITENLRNPSSEVL